MPYGDDEPEDAWDASDTIDDQVRNLARRVALLDGDVIPTTGTIETRLDVITERVQRRRRTPLDARDLLRISQLLDDLRFVRGRLP